MNLKPDLPVVSVVIPAYNAERWIAEAIDSVLAQSYAALELIVVNDGSTDSTEAVVATYVAKDDRVRLIHQENQGLSCARNAGISAASGAYTAFLDADDYWHSEKIERQVNCFHGAADDGARALGLVYCWSQSVDTEGRECRPRASRDRLRGDVFARLCEGNFVGNGSAPMMRTEVLRQLDGFSEQMQNGCEDWALYLRIAQEYTVDLVEEVLVYYRQHGSNMSKDFDRMLQAHADMQTCLEEVGLTLSPAQISISRNGLLTAFIVRHRPFCRGFISDIWAILRKAPCYLFCRQFRHLFWTFMKSKLPF